MKTLLILITLALVVGTLIVLFGFFGGQLVLDQDGGRPAATALTKTSLAAMKDTAHQSFVYGRVSTLGGGSYEGWLRWGGDEEAFWNHAFNGTKAENPWVDYVPHEELPRERRPVQVFGVEISQRERPLDLGRPFLARLGDIARIEADRTNVRVTLKNGTVFDLDRLEACDFDDGLRVWDREGGMVDLDSRQLQTIEFLPAARPDADRSPLYGTVQARQGSFVGFLQRNRQESLGTDKLDGQTADGEVSLSFDSIGSIARHSSDSSLVTLLDGREIVLAGTRAAGQGNRGVYVDDPRYGRVLVSWDAFERVDFSSGGSGPIYDDFPPGSPLTGTVTTRSGRRHTGRLVYDLDESETTETLDAPFEGVDYTIPFGLIGSVFQPTEVPAEVLGAQRASQGTTVILHSGEELRLERSGDLGIENAGLLIFIDGREKPKYVPWADVSRVDLDRPAAMYPPSGDGGEASQREN